MKPHINRLLLVALCAIFGSGLAASGSLMAQTSTIDFVVAGPADWNTATNWDAPGFGPAVPGDGFPQEIASISNAGTATLTSAALHEILGLVIGETHDPLRPGGANAMEEEGTLDISGAGQLTVTDSVRVGDAGLGSLNFSGGALNVGAQFQVAGNADSSANLSGNASLSVGSASLMRTMRIAGPNVTFESAGDVTIRGNFIAEITGPSHSIVDAFGSQANIGDTLTVEFNGHTPTVGEAWTLIEAGSVSGSFQDVQVSGAAPAPGALLQVVVDGGSVGIRFTNALTLQVNRRTGESSMINHIGSIDFDAYTIGSADGALTPGGWSSLETGGQAGWLEANPTGNRLNELNPTGSSVLGEGESFSLGNVISAPGGFAAPDPGLTFEYHQTGDISLSGIVELVGPHNNLVLLVDPNTGQAAIQNQSLENLRLDGFSIGSEGGALDPIGWMSFEDSGLSGGTWLEANPSANRLNELNPTSDMMLPAGGDPISIGMAFDTGVGRQDLTFDFHLVGGGGGPLGDTNGDGVVNIDDLNNVRNNFGGSGLGDTNGDGVVNIDDLNNVRNNFGETGGGGGIGGTFAGVVEYGDLSLNGAAVPEPASLSLIIAGGLMFLGFSRSRRLH